jgi:hypothetical protein
MFEKGHQYGNHNNHYKGGRLTKDQQVALAGLVPKSIEVWRKILEMEVKPKGMSVQADVAGKVLNKFVADLTEGELNISGADLLADFLKCVRDRSSKASEGTPAGNGIVGDSGSVPK